MNFLRNLLVITIVSTFIQSGVYSEEASPRFDFVRPLSMGGAFTAVADDNNIFNFNPAGMVQRTGGQTTLINIAGGYSTDTKEALDFLSDNESDLTNWENLSAQRQAELINEIDSSISKLDPRIYVAADIASYVSGPSFLGMPIHVGFGALGAVDSSFRLNSGIVTPTISYNVNSDVVLPLALAKRWEAPFIPGRIGLGATGKFINRAKVERENQSVLELDDFDTPPVQKGKGLGMDIGALYQPTERWNVGLMVRDFLGTKMSFDSVSAEDGYQALPEKDTVIKPETNVGLAFVPKSLFWLIPTTDRWTFSFDIRDLLDEEDHVLFENGFKNVIGEDFGTHAHMGVEYRWAVFRIRGGANQGYPTFGLGIDLPVLDLNYGFYGTEIGGRAGDKRQDNHIISLALRFGSNKVEAQERIKKRKEEKMAQKMSANDVSPIAESAAPVADEVPAQAGGAADEIPQ